MVDSPHSSPREAAIGFISHHMGKEAFGPVVSLLNEEAVLGLLALSEAALDGLIRFVEKEYRPADKASKKAIQRLLKDLGDS